jgi:hypothetical protein
MSIISLEDVPPGADGTAGPVDFLVAGTQKGGTTALHAYLADHPDLCMASSKEVHFFDNEEVFANDPVDYGIYHAHFRPGHPGQLLGEATPIYMYWQDAPKRIWQYNPAIKLIVVLRNPIDRAFSQWNMARSRNVETLSFWDALHREPERHRQSLPLQNRPFSYVERGYYVEQLRRLWRFFPKTQTLVLRYEDLRDRTAWVLDRVAGFLGIAGFQAPAPRQEYVIPYAETMAPREWAYLKETFEYEIRSIERLLGWDCGAWLKPADTR